MKLFKQIIISVFPKHAINIMKGKKTIEVRKSKPIKIDGPTLVHIYCTSGAKDGYQTCIGGLSNPKVINRKVIGKFILRKIEEIKQDKDANIIPTYCTDSDKEQQILKKSCLNWFELDRYLDGKVGYAWYIEDLEIFDSPRSLQPYYGLDRPPQSWQYLGRGE